MIKYYNYNKTMNNCKNKYNRYSNKIKKVLKNKK